MSKKEEIIEDIKEKQLTRKEIAEKHGVSTTYISQIKKAIIRDPELMELLKFMNEFFNRYSEYLMENPEIAIFVDLNEEKLKKIEELVK